MRCPKCGKMLDNNTPVCPVCGTFAGHDKNVTENNSFKDTPVMQYNNEPQNYAGGDTPLQQYSNQQSYVQQQTHYSGTNTYQGDTPYVFPKPDTYSKPASPPSRAEHTAAKRSGKQTVLLILAVIIILLLIVLVVILIMNKNNGNGGDNNTSQNAAVSSETETTTTATMTAQQTETTSQITTEQTTTDTTTTTTTTKQTTTTTKATTSKPATKIPEDARKNDYVPFDTLLVAKVDEADQLPLRDAPARYSSQIIRKIPDGTSVHVLGFKETDSEVWFRVNYDNTLGWCRGGMLQPNNLNMLYDSKFNVAGLEKWKVKFQLQTPNSTSNYGTASFKGTLYFLPDLSSGVQRRFRSSVIVDVTSKQGEWYYVEFYSDGYYTGWVHSSFLSFR